MDCVSNNPKCIGGLEFVEKRRLMVLPGDHVSIDLVAEKPVYVVISSAIVPEADRVYKTCIEL